MSPGERRVLWVPEALAFDGHPGAPAGDLVYDVELIEALSPIGAPAGSSQVSTDAVMAGTGLLWKVLERGHGATVPTGDDSVTLHYTVWDEDDVIVDSTEHRGHPASLSVRRTIPGLQVALMHMVAGERRRLWIPERLAYAGRPGAPKGNLVMDVELLTVHSSPSTPRQLTPPSSATKTSTGLAYQMLERGSGRVKPTATSLVTVHYSSWTEAGEPLSSSVARGQPSSFHVNEVIPAWSEALQQMVEGERQRLWVPEEIAFAGREGRPAGPLVYDLELIAITN